MTYDETIAAVRSIPTTERNRAKEAVRRDLLSRGRQLSRSDLAVAFVYLDRMNWGEGFCYPGAAKLAAEAGCCRRSVMSARKKLADLGIIITEIMKTDGGYQPLRVTFPHLVQGTALPSADSCTTPSAEDCTPLVQPSAPKPLKRTLEDKPAAKAPAVHRLKVQPEEDNGFDRFWQAYPRKVAKAAAHTAWTRLTGDQRDSAVAALAPFSAKLRRDGTAEKFIPHPATWLNGERFEDFASMPSGTPAADESKYLRNLAEYFLRNSDWDRELGPPPGEPGSKISAALLADVRMSLGTSRTAVSSAHTQTGGRIVPFEVLHAKARG